MSLQVLDRLAVAHEALIIALDSGDLAGIEAATTDLSDAVAGARALQGVGLAPDLKDRISSLAVLAQAAQARVNFLTDHVRRRIDTLATLAGRPQGLTYRPHAR
ncbi:hypothetical protein RCO27_13180 [Sphingosinicella sp. LHD-64]|uniref:hypothetical protein n=1 Tax=Sphingosinicella sp. LHD-64 TaxID=3072139 RepID=UPI00280E952F|nr:hypothetical protein [Sphingosinicella sp. LHD-64]MDQ8757178.1 hypothetical protein [Sphingosinicella sp. LHD-64]